MKLRLVLAGLLVGLTGTAAQARESRGDVGVAFGLVDRHEFDHTDFGFGVSGSYRLSHWFTADLQAGFYPSDLVFSASRSEALLGLRIGPARARVTPFLALRGGVQHFAPAGFAFPCIAIYPPPLTCALGGGDTLPLAAVSAGAEAGIGKRSFARVEIGDHVTRYSGPVLDADGHAQLDHFWRHDLQVTATFGLRF